MIRPCLVNFLMILGTLEASHKTISDVIYIVNLGIFLYKGNNFFSWNHHFAWANSFENILINMCTTKQSILILQRLRDLDTICYFFVIINHKWKKNLVSNNSFDLLNSISIIITSMEKKASKKKWIRYYLQLIVAFLWMVLYMADFQMCFEKSICLIMCLVFQKVWNTR